jgi:ABC-type sugar transport system ATPase subunit
MKVIKTGAGRSMEELLQMKGVSKTFPGVRALDNIRFDIKKGEVHGLVGENGAGKSTLIKILAGVEQPDAGASILFDGVQTNIRKPVDSLWKGISIIYQDLSLFQNLTVAENIYIGRESGKRPWQKIDWREVRRIAKRAVEIVGIDIDLSLPVSQLSIAKQQLVAIARAIVFDARLIIMDEPTSSLSTGEVENLYKIIRSLKNKGISIMFVSHKLRELFEVADRFTVLRDGKYIGTYPKDSVNEQQLISFMVGRTVHYPQKETSVASSPLLEVTALSKKGNFKDISFRLNKGEILGITGLVGSGRTELAQSLFGLNPPDAGSLTVLETRLSLRSSKEAIKHGMAYVPESRQLQGLILRQSVSDNISVAILDRLKNRWGLIQPKKQLDLAKNYIQKLDIRPPYPEMPAGLMSGGNQQKVVIAKWLSSNPKILIIDEPTNGIDIGAKVEIHKLLRKLASEGMGIIMISSELPEILAVSDRVLVMRRGRLVGEVPTHEATEEVIMNLAFLGERSTSDHNGIAVDV